MVKSLITKEIKDQCKHCNSDIKPYISLYYRAKAYRIYYCYSCNAVFLFPMMDKKQQ
jgi:RNase P subunit RPR2